MGPDAKQAYPVLAGQVGQVDDKLFVLLWNTLADLAPYSEAQGNRRESQVLIQNVIHVLNALPREDRSRWSVEYSRFSQRIMVDPKQDVAGLTKMVAQNRMHSREVAVVVLGRMGQGARSALPTIAKALRSAQGRTRTSMNDEFPAYAADAMIRIAPNDPICSVAYGWRLRYDATPARRAAAALRIGSFGARAAAEVPVLRSMLTHDRKQVRWEVITALGMIGPKANSAVPDLKKILASKDKGSAARARAALRQIEKK